MLLLRIKILILFPCKTILSTQTCFDANLKKHFTYFLMNSPSSWNDRIALYTMKLNFT